MAEIALLDFSRARPDPAAVAAAGYAGVLLYLPVPGRDPATCATREQVAAYIGAGLHVGAIFETTAKRASAGAAAGAADGAAAEHAADAWGYPSGAAILWTVDYDAQPADFPALQAYAVGFDGATRRPCGIYGSYAVVEHFVTPGQRPVRYGWQTAAWSGAALSQKANIYQRIGHPNWPVIGTPGDTDENVLCIDLPLMAGAATPAPAPAEPPAHAAPAPAQLPTVPAEAPAPDGKPVHVVGPHAGNSAPQAPAPILDPDGPEPAAGGYAPPGADATGSGSHFRAQYGNKGPNVARLRKALNADLPVYAQLDEARDDYDQELAAVVQDFARRVAADPNCPPDYRGALMAAHGDNVGPHLAELFPRYGVRV